jgi:hypothetical protein
LRSLPGMPVRIVRRETGASARKRYEPVQGTTIE